MPVWTKVIRGEQDIHVYKALNYKPVIASVSGGEYSYTD